MTQTTHPENSGYIGEFRYRYSVGEFEQMADKGAFDDKRVELLYGDVHVLRDLNLRQGGLNPMAAVGNLHFIAMRVLSHELYGNSQVRWRFRASFPSIWMDIRSPNPTLPWSSAKMPTQDCPQPRK